MRLLFVTQDFPPDLGGIQTYAAELARRLAPRCEHFELVAPQRDDAERTDTGFSFPIHRWKDPADLLVLPAALHVPVLARRERFDVAFHTQWQTAAASLLSRRLTGYPRTVVVAAHGRELLFSPFAAGAARSLYDRLRRAVLHGADLLLPVSTYTGGLLEVQGVALDRIVPLPNGTDPQVFRPLDASTLRRELGLEGRPSLLTLSRLVPRKGVDTVLRALPALIDAVPDAVYLVAGDGPDRPRLERLASVLGVEAHVRFLGRIPDEELPLFYNLGDVFVMPAREAPPDVEGYGIVFLEAGACEKPVIGARSGGIPDAIVEGETGLLVPPGDPAALAAAAAELLTRREVAERLGRAGRARMLREASWDRVADRAWDVLTRFVADFSPSPAPVP